MEAQNRKRFDNRNMEYGASQPMTPSRAISKPEYAGSPSAESNTDPSPAGQDLGIESRKRDSEDVSPYESKVGYRSRKGDRFS